MSVRECRQAVSTRPRATTSARWSTRIDTETRDGPSASPRDSGRLYVHKTDAPELDRSCWRLSNCPARGDGVNEAEREVERVETVQGGMSQCDALQQCRWAQAA